MKTKISRKEDTMDHSTAVVDQNHLANGGLQHNCVNNYTNHKMTNH